MTHLIDELKIVLCMKRVRLGTKFTLILIGSRCPVMSRKAVKTRAASCSLKVELIQ